MTIIQFTAPVTLAADLGKRRLRGRAVPWNVTATVSTGQRVKFLPGSVDLTGTPVVLHHDDRQPIGRVIDQASTDDGLDVTAAISEVSDGDTALVLAADEVLTGFSVGVEPTEFAWEDDGNGLVMVVSASEKRHLALVTIPAFTEARVTDVAASAAIDNPEEGTAMTETTTVVEPEEPAVPAVVASAPRVHTAPRPLPTAGEWLYAAIHQKDQPQAWLDIQATVKAAAPHTFVADVPGLIPKAIVGDVFAGRPEDRPIVDSLGPFTGPDGGKTFSRPVITDPVLDAAAGTEKTDMSDTLGVTGKDFTYEFIKRAVNLSAESIAFTSPQVLDVALRDLARAYNRGTEKAAATALEGIDGTATSVAADAFEAAVAAASGAMYGTLGEQVDRIWLSVEAWQHLYGAKGTDGRPMFPRLGPANANGTNGGIRGMALDIGGIPTVTSWALTAGAAVVGSSAIVECYENHRVSMRADEPTILGVAASVGGAIALGALNAGGASKFTVTAQAATP